MAERIVVLKGDYTVSLRAVRHFCGYTRKTYPGPSVDSTVVSLTDEEMQMIKREYKTISLEDFVPEVHDLCGLIRRQIQPKN